MKKTKAEAAETRRRIVKVAATEFGQNGIHETGLPDLMAAVCGAARSLAIEHAISNGFGFGGVNASLLLRRVD